MEEIRVILRFRIPGGSAKGAANSVVHERVQKNAFIEHVHFYENDELNATSWQIMNLNGEHVHIIWGQAPLRSS